jgi:acylphosphatase
MIFKILVSGRVQGVNFRNMTKAFADESGILGSVRNLENGKVEICVECSPEVLESLVEWLKSSPGFSSVNSVKVEEVKEKKGFEGFEIIRD